MKRLLLIVLLAASTGSVPAYGHHSFAAQYLEDQMISIEGEIVQVEFQSPHILVHVMAKDSKGELQRFAAEWANPNRLARQGITKDTLKVGDRVIITGSPGRKAAEHKLHLKGIERPADGWKAGNTTAAR